MISAIYQDNDMVQVNVESLENESLLGNIYIGKVKNIVRNINAAFVEIANGTMCYLSLEDCEAPIYVNPKKNKKLTVGDELFVQVTKENVKTKAPMVVTSLSFTGKYVVLTHGKLTLGISNKINDEKRRVELKELLSSYKNKEYGLILRTNTKEAKDDLIKAEIERLIISYKKTLEFGIHKTCYSLIYKAPANYLCDIRDGQSKEIDEFITDDKEIYEEMKEFLTVFQPEDLSKLNYYQDNQLSLSALYSVKTKLEKALQERVWLKSGGYLVIQPTEALTVIDVNTGKAIAGKKNEEETFYKINQEAAVMIAKQLRLRNLSGIIIIDFIDMKVKENKVKLMELLRNYCNKDNVKTTVVDMTALHLVEVTRKKVRKPLYEQIK